MISHLYRWRLVFERPGKVVHNLESNGSHA